MGIHVAAAVLLPAVAAAAPSQAARQAAIARKGPIELTLRVRSLKIKASQPVWYQIRLMNAGRRKLWVADDIFEDPWAIRRNCDYRTGIYLDVRGPGGKEVPPRPAWASGTAAPDAPPPPNKPPHHHDSWLLPGESTTTASVALEEEGASPPRAVEGFANAWMYDLRKPGRYRIRAVYDFAPDHSARETRYLRQHHLPEREPWQVRFATPFIEVEVLP